MTKEITKAFILQEIQNKFAMREFDPAKFLFDETVVPVYEIKHHLEEIERVTQTLSITATGARPYFSVPEDEQWYLQRYNVIFVTGVFTIAGLFVGRPTSSDYTYLDLTAAQNTSYINDLPKEILMRTGDQLYLNVDGYTSTGDLMLIAEVIKESIR